MRTPRVAIIPARFASQRFPGKALAPLAGKPMLLHVVERVRDSGVFDSVWVATDDERIARAVRGAGGEAFMTRADHGSGTERVAELAERLPAEAIVFNVQGDEPLLPVALLAELMSLMESDPSVEFATAAHAADDAAGFASPNVVKVVVDGDGRALYFSRASIPASRRGDTTYLRHVGIYAFRRHALSRFVALPAGVLERREGLEQLRALENQMHVHVLRTRHESIGVDTPEDLEAVARRLAGGASADRSQQREGRAAVRSDKHFSRSHARYVT